MGQGGRKTEDRWRKAEGGGQKVGGKGQSAERPEP